MDHMPSEMLRSSLEVQLRTNTTNQPIFAVENYKKEDLQNNDLTRLINSELQKLCDGTELNYEYAFCSMFQNDYTLVVKRTMPSLGMRTRSMTKIIGFVSYSIKKNSEYLDHYNTNFDDNDIINLVVTDANNSIYFPIPDCINVDVIVTGQGAKGLGSLLLKNFNTTHNVYLKSVKSAYWFYIKQKFIHFNKTSSKYAELPYKYCNQKYYTSKKEYVQHATRSSSIICPNSGTDNFKSWYDDDDGELIPLVLPAVSPQAGGESSSEYVTILGRRRKIIMNGRKKMVNVNGTLVSLTFDSKRAK